MDRGAATGVDGTLDVDVHRSQRNVLASKFLSSLYTAPSSSPMKESRRGYVDPHRALTDAEDNELRVVRELGSHHWLKSIYDLNSWIDSEKIMEIQLDLLHTYGAGNHKDRQAMKSDKLNENLVSIVVGDGKTKPLWKYEVLYIPLSARQQHWFMGVVSPNKKNVTLYDSMNTDWKEKNELVVAQIADRLRWLFHILDCGAKF
ncbi:uncharacterized protein LOC131252930 isoform X2 [Magnolia sinica]|uniref:uncharacterized protein LOC131252930 isoform X2 n=1 Tax=Magnolia sinica TaxID=86752 RepID=UPI002657D3B9|nr:uncharacterized protein LOC131252930 isoform X2 [Magnolia sinica]